VNSILSKRKKGERKRRREREQENILRRDVGITLSVYVERVINRLRVIGSISHLRLKFSRNFSSVISSSKTKSSMPTRVTQAIMTAREEKYDRKL
jgi:hypothetical protein